MESVIGRRVYVVLEEELESGEFPNIVLAVTFTKRGAERVIRERKRALRAEGQGHKLRGEYPSITFAIDPTSLCR